MSIVHFKLYFWKDFIFVKEWQWMWHGQYYLVPFLLVFKRSKVTHFVAAPPEKKKNLSIYLQGVRKRNRLGKHPLLLVVKEELGEKKDFRLSPRCGHVLFNLFISNRIQPFTTCKAFH